MPRPDLRNITIQGPFWQAEAEVVSGALSLPEETEVPVLLFEENFNSFNVNVEPSQWRSTAHSFDTNVTDVSADLFKVLSHDSDEDDPDHRIFGTRSEFGNLHSHLTGNDEVDPQQWTNYRYTGRLRFNNNDGGAGVTVFSQYPLGIDQYYALRREGPGNPNFEIVSRVPGGFRALGGTTRSELVGNADTWYRFSIEIASIQNQTVIQAKVWEEGTPEPDTFEMVATDSNIDRATAGTIGVWTTFQGEKYFDDFQVHTFSPTLVYSGFRTLFVDSDPRTALGVNNAHMPGTLTALCHIRSIEMQPAGSDALRWEREEDIGAINIDDADELSLHLQNGTLCNLVLHTDPDAWPVTSGDNPPFRCLNGDIFLEGTSGLVGQEDAGTALFDALPISAPTGPTPGIGAMSFHASGLSLYADAALPWQDDAPVTAPFLVSQVYPDADEDGTPGGYRVSIEHERLSNTEHDQLTAAWMNLSHALNPAFPQNDAPSSAATPRWMTLEIPNPNQPPRIFWQEAAWSTLSDATIPLRYERGEFTLLISDQQPYDPNLPPSSLAQVIPAEVQARKVASDTDPDVEHLLIEVNPGSSETVTPDAEAEITGLNYEGALATDQWEESIQLEQQRLAFNPVDIARRIRRHQGLVTPEWDKADEVPIDPATLWGFLPLADGWAQLPIPNLTEQIYLDAGLDNQPDPDEALAEPGLKGAAVWGNDDPAVLDAHPNEAPWSLSVINTSNVQGVWTLVPVDTPSGGSEFSLNQVKVTLEEPEVIVNGLLWLSTGQPRIQDALPDLDNWASGLMSVPLRTADRASAIFESVVVFDVSSLQLDARPSIPSDESPTPASASLQAWSAHYDVNVALMERMIAEHVLSDAFFSAYTSLLWRRHAHVPMIQALPLTQAQYPPNYPSPSRQLAPFALPLTTQAQDEDGSEIELSFQKPDRWIFGVAGSAFSSAATFPHYLDASELEESAAPLAPTPEWESRHDLPMVSLSLPGLVLDPKAPELPFTEEEGTPLTGLQAQWRYDVPLTDEIQALSQITSTQKSGSEDNTPLPLTRERFATHWFQLSEKANLAAGDAIEALDAEGDEDDRQLIIRSLVEPYIWSIEAGLHLDNYPGRLQLNDAGQPLPDGLTLESESALEGISASFNKSEEHTLSRAEAGDGSTHTEYTLKAGSMAALIENLSDTEEADPALRDQRGLYRRASQVADAFVRTRVSFEETPGALKDYDLTSTVHTEILGLDTGNWSVWFRDLPMAVETDFTLFDRSETQSERAEDNNDPEAHSRTRNFLNGYEWRLLQQGVPDRVTLFNLDFYPLSLDRVKIDGNAIVELDMSGRLQLPLPGSAELTDFSNAVRLLFTLPEGGSQLELSDIEMMARAPFPTDIPDGLSITETAPLISLSWAGDFTDEDQESLLDLPGDGAFKAALRELIKRIKTDTTPLEVSYLPDPRGDWPLALEEGENTSAPHLYWDAISVRTIGGTKELVLGTVDPDTGTVSGDKPCLRFSCFNAPWVVELQEEIVFKADPDVLLTTYTFDTGASTSPILPSDLDLSLDLISTSPQHLVTLALNVKLGEDATLIPFTGTVRFPILGRSTETVQWESTHLFTPVSSDDGEGLALTLSSNRENDPGVLFANNALEAKWNSYAINESEEVPTKFFLPGMELAKTMGTQDTPGYACMTFDPDGLIPALDQVEHIPELHLRNAFVEALIACTWGEATDVFAGSSGNVAIGYTLTLQEGSFSSWVPSFTANGIIDVINMISYPHEMKQEETFRRPQVSASSLLNHSRHRVRILLNQHTIPPEILQGSTDPALVLHFTAGSAWQLLSVVEHTLVDVTQEEGMPFTREERPLTSNDRRWTALQEVRLLQAENVLAQISDFAGNTMLAPSPSVIVQAGGLGTMRDTVRDALVEELTTASARENLLIVEASAPHWIRKTPVNAPAMVPLQFLPQGTQEAMLSSPEDFMPSPSMVSPVGEAPSTLQRDPQWLLFYTIFIGRLQNDQDEAITDALSQDPVLVIQDGRESANPLSLALAGWDAENEVPFQVAAMDRHESRSWLRLDPTTLEENWFRIQHPLAEDTPETLPSVIAALPNTSARLSRAKALAYAVHNFTPAYPPREFSSDQAGEVPGIDIVDGTVVWRQDRLFTPQVVGISADEDFQLDSWQLFGALLLDSIPEMSTDTSTNAPTYFTAATLIPRPATTDTSLAAPSLTFALSPYLGIGFRNAPSQVDLNVISAELLCQDRTSGSLTPIASQYWEKTEGETRSSLKTHIQRWARESHRRLAPESRLGVLRFREVNAAASFSDGDTAGDNSTSKVTTTFGFALVTGISQNTELLHQLISMRSPAPQLRFREGQFGGFSLPDNIKDFEIAPPQVSGVQPIYETQQPKTGDASAWPWGLSTLRTHIRYTNESAAVIGTALDPASEDTEITLWWQAIQRFIQFRSLENRDSDTPVGGLPALFRARAIRSLLAALPDPPMPAVNTHVVLNANAEEPLERWQPVLPGNLSYMTTGSRPGVMQAARHALIRQNGLFPENKEQPGKIMTSGSIPIQHRTPRPVPLPDTTRRETALQTWANFFQFADTVRADNEPFDEVLFIVDAESPSEKRLHMKITNPANGALASDWNGDLNFLRTSNVSLDSWLITMLSVTNGSQTITYFEAETPLSTSAEETYSLSPAKQEEIANLLGKVSPGDLIYVAASVKPASTTDGFSQALLFPLRMVDPQAPRLPLEQRFIHFEDPEYNRQLASSAAQAAKAAIELTPPTDGGTEPVETEHRIVLASDRKTYNSDSILAFRFDWPDGFPADLITSSNITYSLNIISASGTVQTPIANTQVAEGVLQQIGLANLFLPDGRPITPAPGDTVEIELKLVPQAFPQSGFTDTSRGFDTDDSGKTDVLISLKVDVVLEPVNPVTGAGYALLRKDEVLGQPYVACARFAWGPAASRIELVNPNDLLQETVRRRAVFQWRDTIHTLPEGVEAEYVLQKVTPTGSTHVPSFPDTEAT